MSEAVDGSSAAAGGDSWVYFVGYAHSKGFGDLVIELDTPISGPADVDEVRRKVVEWEKVSDVHFTSFLLLPSGDGGGERTDG